MTRFEHLAPDYSQKSAQDLIAIRRLLAKGADDRWRKKTPLFLGEVSGDGFLLKCGLLVVFVFGCFLVMV